VAWSAVTTDFAPVPVWRATGSKPRQMQASALTCAYGLCGAFKLLPHENQ
jgi:hypothetical protein